MGYLDTKYCSQYQADIAKRVFTEVKHTQRRNNDMWRITHPLETMLPTQMGHGRTLYVGFFPHKERVVTLFVAATVVTIMLVIMMQKACFATNRA